MGSERKAFRHIVRRRVPTKIEPCESFPPTQPEAADAPGLRRHPKKRPEPASGTIRSFRSQPRPGCAHFRSHAPPTPARGSRRRLRGRG